jgi:hypothetical protein
MTRKRVATAAVLILTLIGYGFLVWPTPYRFDHLKQGNSDVPVRTNRFTGQSDALSSGGWIPLGARSRKISPGIPPDVNPNKIDSKEPAAVDWRDGLVDAPATRALGPVYLTEPSDITGKCATVEDNVDCEIYNGSRYRLSEVGIQVKVKGTDGTLSLQRLYNLTPDSIAGAAPLTSARFLCRVGFALEPNQNWNWQILWAKGTIDQR